MSQIRLYLDEDAMRRALVFGLRARNVDVLTASEAGLVNHEYEEHLAAASDSRRTLFTYNTTDYCVLHQRWMSLKQNHAGIITARQQHYTVGEQLRRIMRLISIRTAEELENRLEFLSNWATK
jgi:hypothetical protein